MRRFTYTIISTATTLGTLCIASLLVSCDFFVRDQAFHQKASAYAIEFTGNINNTLRSFDSNLNEVGPWQKMPDIIGEITLDGDALWLSAPAGKIHRFGKNVYRFSRLSGQMRKVIKSRGVAPNKLFVLDPFVYVSILDSDSNARPYNSGLEVYQHNIDHSLTHVKSIYLDPSANFLGDKIDISPSKDTIYIASSTRLPYEDRTERMIVLYAINTKTHEIESKVNLVEYFGAAGGIAVSEEFVYLSSIQKYPGFKGGDDIEASNDYRLFVFDRKTLSLKKEIHLTHHSPYQLALNHAKNLLLVKNSFRESQAIAIVDTKLNKEIAVLDELGFVHEIELVDDNTLFAKISRDGIKGIVAIDLTTFEERAFVTGNFGALSFNNRL